MMDPGTVACLALACLVGFVASIAYSALRDRYGRPHVHTGHMWDGWYEHCRCGASAGDRRDEHGHRMVTFDQWPDPDDTPRHGG